MGGAQRHTAKPDGILAPYNAWKHDHTRLEAALEPEERWTHHVERMYSRVLMRKAKNWFMSSDFNVEGHGEGMTRYLVYDGGAPKYVGTITDVANSDHESVDFAMRDAGVEGSDVE